MKAAPERWPRSSEQLSPICKWTAGGLQTDNGKEFTDRLFGSRAKDASGEHEFDLLCDRLGIGHCLTKPRTPQTNYIVS